MNMRRSRIGKPRGLEIAAQYCRNISEIRAAAAAKFSVVGIFRPAFWAKHNFYKFKLSNLMFEIIKLEILNLKL